MSAADIAINVVHTFLLPPQGLFLALGIGLITCRWLPRVGRILSVSALLLLFMLCTLAGARVFVYPLENLTAPLLQTRGTGAQAIVVLAAGRVAYAPEYGGDDIPDYIALARLRYAARLHRETGLPVLVSGGNRSADGQLGAKASGMARALRDDFAIPVQWLETESNNTAENAAFSAKILKQNGVQRILLVTDAMHMPRSVKVFNQSGLDVVAAPTMFFSLDPITSFHFIPSAEGLRRSYYAIYEWIGIAWYWVRFGRS